MLSKLQITSPGLVSLDEETVPRVYTLLAGCDVRADIYPLATGPLVVYKQQSLIHVEFPRAGYPKLRSVAAHVGTSPVPLFVDACSGPGTLGLAAACLGVPHVVMNDAWYASAFWSAFNLDVNPCYLDIRKVRIFGHLGDMARHPVVRDPVKIAETVGRQIIEVYQGDLRTLDRVIPGMRTRWPCWIFLTRIIRKKYPPCSVTGRGAWAETRSFPEKGSLRGAVSR